MKTIYSKIVVVVLVIGAFGGAGIIYLTYVGITEAIFTEQEKEARNVLNLVMELIANEYENYTHNKLDAVNHLKKSLKYSGQMVQQMFENYQNQAEAGLISEAEARRLGLKWLNSQSFGPNIQVFIYNLDLIGIHAVDPQMVGRRLAGFRDLRGQDALLTAKEMVSASSAPDLVVFWPQSGRGPLTKHVIHFTFVPKWSWIVATAAPIEDLEAIAEKHRREILINLEKNFSHISTLRPGYLFLFDGNQNFLIHPSLQGQPWRGIVNPLTGKKLGDELISAATSGGSVTYEWVPPGSKKTTEKKIAMMAYFKAFDWFVGYTLPVSDLEILGRVIAGRQVQVITLTLVGLCLAIVVFLKIFFKPLTMLTKHTKALIDHHFRPPKELLRQLDNLAGRSQDERGELARSFSAMQAALDSYLSDLMETNSKLVNEIDERRQIEAELVNYQNHLEKLVEHRTAELEVSNQDLRQEIVERKKTQESLQENQRLLAKAEEIAHLGSWEWNLQNDQRTWSDQHFRNMGYQPGEIIPGWPGLLENIHPDDREQIEQLIESVKSPQNHFQLIYRVIHPNGDVHYIKSMGELIKDDAGRPWKYSGTSLDITTEKLAENKLRSSLKEKEILLQEVHHRVKNNMQVIISLLHLEQARINDQTLIEFLRDSENRIKSMAMVHESLYRSADLAAISFDKYIPELVYTLADSFYRPTVPVEFKFDLQELELTLEQAVPVSLIMTELISNAYKYAFRANHSGTLSLACRTMENKWGQVRVADNGPGLPTETSSIQSSSLGLGLVNGLATKQLLGSVQVIRESGTEFIICWPLAG